MHLRLPAFSRGITSFAWAFGLALYIWLGLLAIGTSQAASFLIAALSGFFIFLFVRVSGDDAPSA